MSERFAERLARQIEVGETMLLEYWVNGHWKDSDFRKWLPGTHALLEKEYGSSSGTVRWFLSVCVHNIEEQERWADTLENALEVLDGIRQSVAPFGDEGD